MRLFLILVSILMLAAPAKAQSQVHFDFELETFEQIPVLHDGRIKPLKRYAGLYLEKLSAGHVKTKPSLWLANTLFDPQSAARQPLFYIPQDTLVSMLHLTQSSNNLYSLEELTPGLIATEENIRAIIQQEKQELTPEQRALVDVHTNALIYSQFLKALSPLLPLDIQLPEGIEVQNQSFESGPTYLELKKLEPKLLQQVKDILAAKGEDIDSYTGEEKTKAALVYEMQLLQVSAVTSTLFMIIPPQWQGSEEWTSPSSVFDQGQGSPKGASYLKQWQDMAKAWRDGDKKEWRRATVRALDAAYDLIGPSSLKKRMAIELLYDAVNPFGAAKLLYFCALLLLAIHIWQDRTGFYLMAVTASVLGFLMQTLGLFLRIEILERPPVGSLYESLLFVSAVITMAGLLIEGKRRDGLSLCGALLATLVTLFIAPYIAPNGDDLEMLVAVLNTNFWLATHVICITAGYGLCIMTAVLAHIFLIRRAFNPEQESNGLFRNIFILSLFSLFFTAFGTVLGGIWADQSWGRFWGWDPKENGALLIVLWLIWVHHGKIGGYFFRSHGFCAFLAALNIVVALSWFGVNLLSVGLHSYGFISGIAAGLSGFCIIELSAISFLYLKARGRKEESPNEA